MNLKKEDLIEGKIYQVYAKEKYKYLVKKNSKKYYICFESVDENPFFSSGFSNIHNLYSYKEATPEESHWLEECIKANKFIPKEEALKNFKQELLEEAKRRYSKIGIVVNQKAAYNLDKDTTNIIKFLDCRVIDGIRYNNEKYLNVSVGGIGVYNSKYGIWAEIIEDKPKSLVGRYIKALVDYPASGSVRIGEIGIVVRNINSDKLRVDFPSQSNYSIDKWHFDKKRVELLPEDYKPESNDLHNGFKIGSLYKSNCGRLAYYVGLSKTNNFPIFELKDPIGTSIPGNNEFPDNYISKGSKTYWRYRGLDSQFICEEIIEEWIPKVGDWIYILDTGGRINRNNDLEINKAYKISKLHNEKCGDINADLEGLKDRIRIKDGCITFGDHSKLYRKALDHEIPKCSTSVGEIKYSDTSGLVVDNTKPMEANWSIGSTTEWGNIPLDAIITVGNQSVIYGTSGYNSSQITFSKHIPKTIKPITLDSKPNDLILGVKPNYPKQIKKIVL